MKKLVWRPSKGMSIGYVGNYILTCRSDSRRGFGLHIAFIDHSKIQATTAPSLISTIHKSPQHLLSIFQPAVSSPTVPCQWLLTVEILPLHALKFSLHSLPHSTHSVAPVVFLITSRHGPRRKPPFPTVPPLLRKRVYRDVAQKRPWYIHQFRGRCITTALHATVSKNNLITTPK
jgi:hypothetical protein